MKTLRECGARLFFRWFVRCEGYHTSDFLGYNRIALHQLIFLGFRALQ